MQHAVRVGVEVDALVATRGVAACIIVFGGWGVFEADVEVDVCFGFGGDLDAVTGRYLKT